ncbi:MAG: DUF4832 domain-containing protein [Bacteroidales bacterium]|nr:DUF4832 domain-containing protein [Bacteroidales bacterium]
MKQITHILKIPLLLALLGTTVMVAGQTSVITYTGTEAELPNPERGWYDQYTTHSGGASLGTTYNTISTEELRNKRENDNMTLVLRLFMLHQFLEDPDVSAEYISNVQADFDTIRAAGMKCIVRFAYSRSQSAEVWDATPEIVFSHILSLGDVLAANSDVIAAVQAGFIGAWGEWYYTKNFASQGYVPDATDQENRRKLVEHLLDVLPENIVVEGRTPAIMENLVGSEDPISADEAYDGSYKSRIGHHNDCFVASATDYGTYTNLEEDLAYLHETTKYTITGGETCNGSTADSDCDNSVSRMSTLHWTYMNRGYHPDVYEKWEAQGCFDEVNISIGYRLRLVEATIDNAAAQGDNLNLVLNIQNDGYAAPSQYKPIQIVLTHTVTGDTTLLKYSGTNDDIRFWLPGAVVTEGSVEVPADLPDGNYRMALRLPDRDTTLAEFPWYAIRLANPGVWHEATGSNDLNHIVEIGAGGTGALPEAPSGLDATTVSETQVDLSWTDNSMDETGFELMRAGKGGTAWEPLATLGPDVNSYQDVTASKGTDYSYIIRSMNAYGYSAWSDSASARTLGVYLVNEQAPAFEMYPNPLADADLTMRFNDQDEKTILIHDATGKNIYTESTRENYLKIASALFNPGMYIVKVQGNAITKEEILIVL